MKSFYAIFIFLIFFATSFTSKAQDEKPQKNEQEISIEKVKVYYFHNERRCATCNAVEEVTKTALKEYYPEQVKTGVVTFQSLNIEDSKNESIAKDLRISGQTLLIITDGKKKDLTNDAFMYARSNPDKLKEKIHKAIGTI